MRQTRPALTLCVAAALTAPIAAQTTISAWTFPTVTAAPYNNPTADTDTSVGKAAYLTALGMTNSYTYSTTPTSTTGSVSAADVLATTGAPSGGSNAWRVRGPATNSGVNTGNGWNLAAPQYTQGAQINTSTVGYTNVAFRFDWFTTNQGVHNLEVQYNLNANLNRPHSTTTPDQISTAGWVNYAGYVATPNAFSPSTINIDLSGIAGTANNPNLGIRLVSAYDPTYTGAGAPTYTAATSTTSSPLIYNNNSGNWRFANISYTGTVAPVPEPASVLALSAGVGGLFWARRRKSAVT